MAKYKYFLLLFSGMTILSLWFWFPISFDNNDDQAMFAISSGLFSGTFSHNIILSNIVIGKGLNYFFKTFNLFNWYTFYLQLTLILCFLSICYLFLREKKSTILISLFSVFFIFSFFSISVIKLQFTTVALFCTFTALFFYQIEMKYIPRAVIVCFFVFLSILIRKEAFFVFILFCFPVFIINSNDKMKRYNYFSLLIFSILLFFVTVFYNNNDSIYKKQQTINNVEAFDIIAGKPINTENKILTKHNFTVDDIKLLQSWFIADSVYLTGIPIKRLSNSLKTNREINDIYIELIKFIKDERYALFLYLLTCIFIFFFVRESILLTSGNFFIFIFFIFILVFTSRIPHRITFPVLAYLSMINVYQILKNENLLLNKRVIFSFIFLFCSYKIYCTSKLYSINKTNHSYFDASIKEIKNHPKSLFIALDDFKIQNMNAWLAPDNNQVLLNNIILTGWYACSPDYQILLNKHNIKNLTVDLYNKNNVLFLTSSETLQKSYVNVLQQRYNIRCHFQNEDMGFKYLHPKKLVFDD